VNEKDAPETLALRASPKPVVRLNRRVIAVGLGGIAAAIAIALSWGFRHRTLDESKPQEPQIQNIPHADRLDALPKDYAGIPKLGAPLGELNAPVVKAEEKAGLDVMPQRPDFRSDPSEDAARAARLNREREAESAATAQVFFPLKNVRAEKAPVVAATSAGETADASTESPVKTQSAKRAFVDQPTDKRIYNSGSLQQPLSRWQLMAGTVIPAALVTGIISDLPGQVIAAVTESVYDSATGKALLIPQGTRLLGQYDAQITFGQRRLLLVWTRLVMPDGSSIVLDRTVATDTAGNAGLEDGVDWHWKRLLAGAALSSLVGVGAELAQPGDASGDGRIVIASRQSTQDSVNQVGQEITRRNLDIQPTLTVRPGYPIRAVVEHDLVLRPYNESTEEVSG